LVSVMGALSSCAGGRRRRRPSRGVLVACLVALARCGEESSQRALRQRKVIVGDRSARVVRVASYDPRELRRAAARARNASTDGSVVVVTASRDYAPVLLNWLSAMERLGVRNWVVVCFDTYMRTLLEKRGATTSVTCWLGQWSKRERLRRIWTLRVEMLGDLVEAGFGVTLSDLDAIWLRDAHPYLGSADIVASRGSFPPWLSSTWGATACMGLIRFNVGSRRFVRRALKREVTENGDDQIAINLALDKDHVRWNAPNITYVGSTHTSTGVTRSGVTVALLPHTLFVRRCDLETHLDPARLVVSHCYTPKTVGAKRTSLATSGSWLLRDDWISVPPPTQLPGLAPRSGPQDPHPVFSAWLRSISTAPASTPR